MTRNILLGTVLRAGRIVEIRTSGAATGAPVAVVLRDEYQTHNPPGWPVRGGSYAGGQTAAFLPAEAEALVAAGVATYA